MDYRSVANDIYKCIGGQENIVSAAHCATRLRLVIADNAKCSKKELENIDGVKGVFEASGQLQIILGTGTVNKVYDEFMTVYQRLIPALALQYCKDNSFAFEHEGSTTSSFDSVKQFYLDVYEALGNLMIIPVALNNIKYRSDINAMNMLLIYSSNKKNSICSRQREGFRLRIE